MTDDITGLSLTEVAQAIARRHLSSVEVTQACLSRMEAWQSSRNSFIDIRAEDALAQARQCDEQLRSRGTPVGPLYGVPVAHKDMFYRTGRVSTCGSLIRRDWVPDTTATVLQRLDTSGAVDVGTLNMSEFAGGPTGHNSHYGHCTNAWHPDYMAGGSSSGSGSAVGARLIYGSLGSDTGGSIRLPASANGIVGIKPTHGRVSRHGAMARSWSLDSIGVLARNAADCARLLEAVAGHDPKDDSSSRAAVPPYSSELDQSVSGLRIGVPDLSALVEIDPQVQQAMQASLAVLSDCGAHLVPVPFGDMSLLFQVAETIIKSEGATMHGPWIRSRPQDYTTLFRSRTEAGLLIPATQYIDALRLRTRLTREFMQTTLRDVDVLHLPTLPFPVPTLAESDADNGQDGTAIAALIGRVTLLTRPVNLLGLPAISAPCGFCSNGLPIGFQLVGHPFSESRLLATVHTYEQQSGLALRCPALLPDSATPLTQG